jgi:hypothetical protein
MRRVIQPPHPYAGWSLVENSSYPFHVEKVDPETGEIDEARGNGDPYSGEYGPIIVEWEHSDGDDTGD